MFLSELVVEWKNDRICVICEPLEFRSVYLAKKIIVPRGFETDFASVPRIPFIYAAWGDKAHREAVIHDYLYRKDSKPVVSFHAANRVFLEAMKDRAKPWAVRWPMYLAVEMFGRSSYHKKSVADKL